MRYSSAWKLKRCRRCWMLMSRYRRLRQFPLQNCLINIRCKYRWMHSNLCRMMMADFVRFWWISLEIVHQLPTLSCSATTAPQTFRLESCLKWENIKKWDQNHAAHVKIWHLKVEIETKICYFLINAPLDQSRTTILTSMHWNRQQHFLCLWSENLKGWNWTCRPPDSRVWCREQIKHLLPLTQNSIYEKR